MSAPESDQPQANPFAGLQLSGLPPGPPDRPKKLPRLVLRRERAQRGGKTVVVIAGIPPGWGADRIGALAREARKACGCGGTVRGAEIEIQGDQPGRVRAFLEGEGFTVVGP